MELYSGLILGFSMVCLQDRWETERYDVSCGSRCWDTTHHVGFSNLAVNRSGDNVRPGSLTGGGRLRKGIRRSKVPSEWLETIRKSQKGKSFLDTDGNWSQVQKMRLSDQWYKVGLPSLNG